MPFDQRALQVPHAAGVRVGAHYKRYRVGPGDGHVAHQAGHDGFARLGLAVLHRLRNVAQLEQGIVGVHVDAQSTR
ncbi:hypothetical protein D3C72_2304570 [compost metagenome]